MIQTRLLFILLLTWSGLFAQIPAGYYDAASGLSGEQLKAALNDIIDGHTELSYDNVTIALRTTDEDPNNSNNVICLYTGWSYGKFDFGNGSEEWNREHVWSKSHGDFGDSPPAGTDLHHLRPADASVNSMKNNMDFDEGLTEYIDASGATGCYYSTDVWEPRAAVKGDVARMIFYMATRYEGENGEVDLELVDYVFSSPNSEAFYGNLETLLTWHSDDPVDDWERDRNDAIYGIQGNRNPYIDHPEYVDLIWGDGILPEPSNHVSDFSANTITLEWVDATGDVLPDGYLILMSDTGFGDIVTPVDGTPVANGFSAKNVAYGVQKAIFGLLTPGTTYYFKMYGYTGEGASIDYKTDGDVPQVSEVAR